VNRLVAVSALVLLLLAGGCGGGGGDNNRSYTEDEIADVLGSDTRAMICSTGCPMGMCPMAAGIAS
jgi:hypothetical protein